MRPYLPLLQLIKRDVPSAADETASSAVFDIPVNLLLHRTMQIESETALSETHPGGKLLRGEEIEANSLTSEHVNCVPTRREGNVMNSNHNGALAKSTPFFGFDGIRASVCGRKVYVHDCCACEVGGVLTLGRLMEIFYDDVRRLVLVTVRLFRTAAEVRGVGEEERRGGLLRVWEDCSPGSGVELEAAKVLGLVEMETPQNRSGDGGHPFPWDRFYAEGFVTAAGTKRRHQGDAMPKPFKVSEAPWHAEGTTDKPLFGVRHQGVHLNDMNLAFYSAPVVFSCDAFNAWGLGNKHSIGGSYFGWGWRSQAVQRLKNQTHVGTLATPGARSEGENGLQCEILGLLQQGCLGRRVLRDEQGARSEEEVFVRGGLLLMCGDGPGRSKCLGTKAPNNFSKFPCSYCMVSHGDDETGGDVGNPQFDIDKHRRTWGRTMDGFSELEALADDPLQQEERSKELGLVAPNASGLKLPRYHAMRIVPGDHVPVERLHFDALVSEHDVYPACERPAGLTPFDQNLELEML
ncbi:unnamed protein product [Ectocarpus sp. CCAP 1310/34]|nr:unnamed protein product [Ectocarpus sp. CCAP 1310/34]